jgi:phosphatidylinositol alpha-mannosyltransferase
MRIALVCPYDIGRFGGVQNQVTLIASTLRRRGHDAWVVAPGESDQPMRSLGASGTWSFNDSTTPIKLSPLVARRMRAAVADADVVHVHEPLMPLVSIAARWSRRPLVGTFHADPSRFVRFLYRGFPPLRWHVKRFSSLAAVSETALSAVAGFGDVGIIPNGVDTRRLPNVDRVLGRVVFVGRNDRRKGLDVALAAIRSLRETHPAAHLVIISPDPIEPEPGVEVRRNIPDALKAELLASAEIFIAPNRRGESFGLTVAEGMAAGAACIVSDIPAFADVVGDTAVLVPPGDASALAAAMADLLDDPARLAKLGEVATYRARRFAIDRTVDAYLPRYAAAVSP